ncbi:DUF2188 domain-containing protein [Lederbergia citrea]|uniref:DUF2188 domain-containing protein n=1 Tax=Lederbergia citrea TaxID=2833581 RepID=A0A942UN46_9BACI|nr:DUF2188 domain-containing protein [Lederbergia citrea]MBS4205262.1 DUF2188 domain-containing protein [Lederbergia citrea]MBS4222877.1 DUF2188 domain-containing protein [Lederbergia citrea]
MPWSKNDFPDSMKNLPVDIREKAIEIANALLEDNKDEGRAISIGIAQARKYYEGDDYDRPEYHITADHNDWVLKKKDGKRAILREDTKEALLEEAKDYVNDHDGILVIHNKDGDISQRLYE